MVKSLLILRKNLQQMHLKLLAKELFRKIAEVTGDLIGNKIAENTKVFTTNP